MITVDDIVARLQGVERTRIGFTALCPSHPDTRASLAIATGDGGRPLLFCHAGCSFHAIVAALGFSAADLAPHHEQHDQGREPAARIVATYDYTDEAGALLYQVVRFEPKSFRQRRPDGRGGWVWSTKGTRRVLFHLARLLAADPAVPAYFVEGEKDVLALEQFGLVVTTNPGGAGKWLAEYADTLRGRHVVVLPDNDQAGREHAQQVAAALAGIAASVRVLELPGLPEKGDVFDWLTAGHTAKELEGLVARAPSREPPRPSGPTATTAQWWTQAKPVGTFLEEVALEAEFLEPRVLARGCVTILHAPRGLGKTHVAHALGVKLARAGHRVLLLDRDNPPTTTRKWLRAWGAVGLDTLRVLSRGEVPSLTSPEKWREFPPEAYDVVILDALDSATEGAGEQWSDRISRALAPLLDLAHRDGGPALLVLSNTVKAGTQGRGSGIIEDRADIVYEIRDATGLAPSGKKAWWRVLPSADRAEWAERAERRTQCAVHRLAFVPSKFRVGEEPAPFALEIDRTTEPWSLRDVTADLDAAGCAARAGEEARKAQAAEEAARRLEADVTHRAQADQPPLNSGQAVAVLRTVVGVSRNAAENMLKREHGKRWRLVKDTSSHGRPIFVVGVNQGWPPEKEPPSQSRASRGVPKRLFLRPMGHRTRTKSLF